MVHPLFCFQRSGRSSCLTQVGSVPGEEIDSHVKSVRFTLGESRPVKFDSDEGQVFSARD